MQTIITVKNNHLDTDRPRAFALNLKDKLSAIRMELLGEGAMMPTDVFLSNGAVFSRNSEDDIDLGTFLSGGTTLIVGPEQVEIEPDDNASDVGKLGVEEPKELLDNIGLFRGLILGEEGLKRSFKNIASWDMTEVAVNKPSPVTKKKTEYTFNEVSLQMKTSGMHSASVSLDTPYGGGEAEYTERKSKSNSTSKISEFLISKFVIQRFALQLEEEDIRIHEDFEAEIKHAFEMGDSTVDYYANIIAVLDKWGYYVPTGVVLGGGLFATQETQISEFEEAESEEQEFSVAFKAKFKGIGGGAAYSQAHGEEKTSSETSKYKVDTFDQIGGLPVVGTDSDAYNKWAESLNDPNNLEVIEYVNLIPSLALLKNKSLATSCANIIMNNHTYPAVRNLQTVLDMWTYGNKLMSKVGNESLFSS